MTPKLSPVLGKTLAVGILAALLGIVYLAVIGPLIGDRDADRASIERLDNALVRYRHVAQELAPLQAKLASLRQDAQAQTSLLHGANETLMAAQIQNRLKELVASAQGELNSSQILPAQADGHLRRIAVRGELSITLEGAQRVFRDIEQGEPLLFLDNVDLRSDEGSRRRRQRGAPTGILQVRLDVYGFTQGTVAGTADKAGAPSARPMVARMP
ncbi:MAG TPA: type II secretion system protein GspM [Stellaceae bacterium]|jgi:general secretion pathway protein M|nr:type II secretion system protein GspM [Stellaceae bacterium]